MSVIPFPRAERHEERLRGIEQCLDALCGEALDMGFDLLAHIIAVAREAAHDGVEELALARPPTAFEKQNAPGDNPGGVFRHIGE